MGLESYLLRLRGQNCTAQRVVEYSQRRFGILRDHEQAPLSRAYSHFVFRDGLHVIEYEFLQESDSCEVSLRFALCHPPSIDRVFLAQVADLMTQFGMEATICEELPADAPTVYASGNLAQFTANCTWSIARSRAYWHQMFGSEEVGLSVTDALQKFFHGVSG